MDKQIDVSVASCRGKTVPLLRRQDATDTKYATLPFKFEFAMIRIRAVARFLHRFWLVGPLVRPDRTSVDWLLSALTSTCFIIYLLCPGIKLHDFGELHENSGLSRIFVSMLMLMFMHSQTLIDLLLHLGLLFTVLTLYRPTDLLTRRFQFVGMLISIPYAVDSGYAPHIVARYLPWYLGILSYVLAAAACAVPLVTFAKTEDPAEKACHQILPSDL